MDRKTSAAAGLILATLCAGQFLMMLDSSVMNVSMATVAKDLDTSITGIQTAITLYTLVMAAFMITGGKIGQIVGRSRAFAIGCVIYGAGSLITALSPNLGVLLIGWSGLEGIGAALILPSIVALVASNFGTDERARAYGLVAAAAAVAVAVGPIVGGFCTTYLSWRYVFAGEVLVVVAILFLARRISAGAPEKKVRLDLVGTALSATGLGLIVFGILRSGTWGFVRPKPEGPEWVGLSPTIWLILAGGLVIWLFAVWENRVIARGGEPLVDPGILRAKVLRGGLTSFFFQYFLQGGLFFAMPLFLSVALGLSAIETGVRLLPLSATLILAAAGVPKLFPHASPRRVVRIGFLAMFAALVVLIAGLDNGAGAGVTTWPMLLAGLGMGALASQLGAITVSSVPDEQSGEVGGLQNTVTNLGISVGTALTGAIVIAALSSSFLTGVESNRAVPERIQAQAQTQLAGGVPFLSDAELETALEDARVPPRATAAIVEENETSRLVGLRTALAVLAIFALVALFLTGQIPARQPGQEPQPAPEPVPEPA
ncbi:MAG TPA: MFS transporter [Solirubrobacterales bacterium]|jgi:MFS family permease|nr:MFS transporter [Solirubrobacterales bacterium]